MEWLIILMPIFLEWLQKCQEKRELSVIEAGLNNPGIIERLALRAVIKQKLGLRGRELRAKVQEGMDELATLEPEDVREIMAASLKVGGTS